MSFLQQNKVAVAVTALLGIGTLAGVVYYMKQSSSISNNQSDASKKKRKNKKKKGKTSVGSSTTPTATSSQSTVVSDDDPETTVYPVSNETKLPELTTEIVSKLSDNDKETWALALKEKGNEYFKAKQYEKAIIYYTNALLCKQDHIFYGNRSACYYALGNTEKTIEDASEALKIKPDYSKCLLRRAHVYEDIGRYEDAMFDLTALSIFGGLTDKSSESVLERVLIKQSNKLNEEVYSNLPKELPSSSSISSFLGAFVKEDIELDLSKYENDSGLYYLISALIEINKDTDEGYENADNYLNQSIERFEKNGYDSNDNKLVAIAYEYTGIFSFLKTNDNAKTFVEKALTISPRPRMYVVLALIAADKGDYLSADAEFTKAIEMNPEDPNIYYHYGQVYYLIGDLKKAQLNFEKAKSLNPKNVFAHIQLACITYRHNEIQKCFEMFNQAKSLFPTAPEIPNYLGEIMFDRGDIEGATKQFDISAKLQEAMPGNNIGVLPLINKSVIYQKTNEFGKCIEILEKAVKLDPKSEVAWTNLGQVYLLNQNVKQSMECFEHACRLCRSSDDRKQTIALLESAKIQLKVKEDPVLNKKMQEIIAKYSQR
ncbi:TOM (translocase of outer membrane) complex component [Pichia californica]|uniref:TOM (Translocase of outer membrane) complex component n=1 Tax=Pichia californica TaxID=460514 RepID=A0A9P6WLK5_9ASCO|nr:TOM (translocase of outer membrane) complex component [[Candida] californica]KAG0689260.1 TOM (translocase of outer membrane) complex component [[Candida] californica]